MHNAENHDFRRIIWINSAFQRAARFRRAILAWAYDVGKPARGVLLITLTFRNYDDRNAKNAIRHFIDVLKKKYRVRKYMWWAEIQKRGVIHYHILVPDAPFLDKSWLSRNWVFGFSWLSWIPYSAAIKYALKYARKLKKAYQQDYKTLSRLYRSFRAFSHNRITNVIARIMKLPGWLREIALEKEECPVRKDGMWCFRGVGVISPYALTRVVSGIGGAYLLCFVVIGVRFCPIPLI